MMGYKFSAIALTILILTACSEGRKTPDGHPMDNPPPSAYAPSDYESFNPDLYESDETETDNTN